MVSVAKKMILCVDDTGDDCELFNFVLTQAGYDVEVAQSMQAALQLFETHQFDLCLFDLSLSDGTGFQLLEKVQSIDPTIPVIICSGDARGSTQQQAMQAGAQAFFTKPIDFDLLIETIARLLHSSEPTSD
jgi:DNA-binding NtrC family response regulator